MGTRPAYVNYPFHRERSYLFPCPDTSDAPDVLTIYESVILAVHSEDKYYKNSISMR